MRRKSTTDQILNIIGVIFAVGFFGIGGGAILLLAALAMGA